MGMLEKVVITYRDCEVYVNGEVFEPSKFVYMVSLERFADATVELDILAFGGLKSEDIFMVSENYEIEISTFDAGLILNGDFVGLETGLIKDEPNAIAYAYKFKCDKLPEFSVDFPGYGTCTVEYVYKDGKVIRHEK